MLWCSGVRIILRRLQKPCSGEKKINREVCSPIPCVLVAENVADSCVNPLEWTGQGKIFESELALDQFCKDHGSVDHFEIKSRDWGSGEKSVFGQAVNCLLDDICWRTIKRKTKLGCYELLRLK